MKNYFVILLHGARRLSPARSLRGAWLTAACACLVAAQVGSAESPPVDSSQQIADRIVNSEIPVVIDFWASWCMPCKILNPIIKKLGSKYAGRIEVIKVNVDVHRSIASYFGISGIPAVFIVDNKRVVKALPGLQPKEKYEQAIEEVLAAREEREKKEPEAEAEAESAEE